MSAERMLKGRKHFWHSVRPMVSVAVSKLGKTDLAFVQPGAKITVFVTVRTYTRTRFTAGNSPYLEQRLRVSVQ